jgi:hypothetical protein
LFFNIGYKYTPIEKMRERLRYKKYTLTNEKNEVISSRYYIINDAGKYILQDKMTGTGYPSDNTIVMNESTFKWATR